MEKDLGLSNSIIMQMTYCIPLSEEIEEAWIGMCS